MAINKAKSSTTARSQGKASVFATLGNNNKSTGGLNETGAFSQASIERLQVKVSKISQGLADAKS